MRPPAKTPSGTFFQNAPDGVLPSGGQAIPGTAQRISWLHEDGADVVLALHIQPGAKRSEVVGQHGDALKIRLAAPPVDGKANAALVAFLAARLGVPKARIELVAGQSSRAKRVRIAGVTAANATAALA